MSSLDRRDLLRAISLGVLATVAGAGAAHADPSPGADPAIPPVPNPTPVPSPGATPPAGLPTIGRVPAPSGVIDRLPGEGNSLALTIDDGTSPEVVAAYIQFCRDTGFRITFFPNGVYSSWTDNAAALRPLVDSGQIALGNHSWSHPDITTLSAAEVTDQIVRNEDFLRNTFGVTGIPFFRPPYGRHNAATDLVATDLGYRTITMWTGTVGDSVIVTEADVTAAATQSLQPQSIVLGHANQRVIPRTYPQLIDLIHSRNLTTVTLADVYA